MGMMNQQTGLKMGKNLEQMGARMLPESQKKKDAGKALRILVCCCREVFPDKSHLLLLGVNSV